MNEHYILDIKSNFSSHILIGLVKVAGVSGDSISRIQCMKAAIAMQLDEMVKSHPRKRVVLITFNNEVHACVRV